MMPRGVPGRVPKELASLTNLAYLYLASNTDLQQTCKFRAAPKLHTVT